MDLSNCVGLHQFLEQIACMDVLEFTENYIYVHFLEVYVLDELWGLSKDQLVKLLRSEELRIEDKYQVFMAAMDWVLQDVAKRKKRGGGAVPSQVRPALPTETLQVHRWLGWIRDWEDDGATSKTSPRVHCQHSLHQQCVLTFEQQWQNTAGESNSVISHIVLI